MVKITVFPNTSIFGRLSGSPKSLVNGKLSSSSLDWQQREEECLHNLKEMCEMAQLPVSDNVIFRFACYYNFDQEKARIAITERFHDARLHLRMEGKLTQQFENKVIFPLPGLRTKYNNEVLYFHASRHFPTETDTETLIRNMCYIFNDMSLTEEQCRNGVAFIVNLSDWTFKNFTNECTNKFLNAIEHQTPTKVEAVLIVNPPRWFGRVWKVMKTMMNKSFVKKYHILKHPNQLENHLMPGFEKYLPIEMGYWQDSNEIVEDFIDRKQHAESRK